jgi:hypothetical protein
MVKSSVKTKLSIQITSILVETKLSNMISLSRWDNKVKHFDCYNLWRNDLPSNQIGFSPCDSKIKHLGYFSPQGKDLPSSRIGLNPCENKSKHLNWFNLYINKVKDTKLV